MLRDAPVDVVFDGPPDDQSVTRTRFRVFSGLYEALGTLKVDLLDRRVRYLPNNPLRARLRYKVWMASGLRAIDGSQLGSNMAFDFTTGDSAGAPQPPAVPAVSARDLQPLWDARCTRCHGAGRATSGVDLSSPDAALRTLRGVPTLDGRGLRVFALDHARSQLMLKLIDRGGISGYAMPPGGPRLDDATLRQVADWIDGGASR